MFCEVCSGQVELWDSCFMVASFSWSFFFFFFFVKFTSLYAPSILSVLQVATSKHTETYAHKHLLLFVYFVKKKKNLLLPSHENLHTCHNWVPYSSKWSCENNDFRIILDCFTFVWKYVHVRTEMVGVSLLGFELWDQKSILFFYQLFGPVWDVSFQAISYTFHVFKQNWLLELLCRAYFHPRTKHSHVLWLWSLYNVCMYWLKFRLVILCSFCYTKFWILNSMSFWWFNLALTLFT